jgi:conjugal transfer ATP-binding protein TraC
MPVVAERQLSNVGMPLPTYRNQVAFYDMFGEENGSTNFNIAVTGTSGAGKSFLTQGILRDVLNAGGYAWVIDMGDSYKNYCHQAGGVYLDGSKLRFNPFANVKDINHSAEGIVRLLTVLASPTQPLDGVCEAILQKAVMDAWEKKANKARIDDVHNYLTNEDVNQASADKPTIIARLAELAMLLDTYCTWGPDGEYFNADTPTLDGETRFAVLELLSLEDKPKLLSSILFSLILAIQEKMYHSPRDLKKSASSTRPGACWVAPTHTRHGLSKPATAPCVVTVARLSPSPRALRTSAPVRKRKPPGTTAPPKSPSCRMRRRLNSTLPITRISSRTWKKKLSVASSQPCRPATAPC